MFPSISVEPDSVGRRNPIGRNKSDCKLHTHKKKKTNNIFLKLNKINTKTKRSTAKKKIIEVEGDNSSSSGGDVQWWLKCCCCCGGESNDKSHGNLNRRRRQDTQKNSLGLPPPFIRTNPHPSSLSFSISSSAVVLL